MEKLRYNRTEGSRRNPERSTQYPFVSTAVGAAEIRDRAIRASTGSTYDPMKADQHEELNREMRKCHESLCHVRDGKTRHHYLSRSHQSGMTTYRQHHGSSDHIIEETSGTCLHKHSCQDMMDGSTQDGFDMRMTWICQPATG